MQESNEIYHVLNRGVDKRTIFLDKQDYFRFIHDFFVFNDENLVNSSSYSFTQFEKINDIASRKLYRKPRKLLVDVLLFCLMPNHYHLLLVPKIENGISKFMQKVDMGYAKYFNQKYERKGTLFERRYKAIQVTEESHFIHLPYYLHCNPLDLIQPEWREGKLSNYTKAIQFLESYRWSSHLDYLGKRNFPSVTKRDFLLRFFEGETGYREALYKWLKGKDKEIEIEYNEYE
jgi:putative transposase